MYPPNEQISIKTPFQIESIEAVDNIEELLYSGGKSGVPRINEQNQVKLIPTDALAKKTPAVLPPIL